MSFLTCEIMAHLSEPFVSLGRSVACRSYIVSMWQFAGVGDKIRVRVNGLDDEGRLSLAFVQREQDTERLPNRRERRRRNVDSGRAEESSGETGVPSFGGLRRP